MKEKIAAIEERSKKIGSSASLLAGSSFAINLVMAGSLSLLWGLINSLQLLTYYPFLNVHFPINVNIYLAALFDLANMDVLPSDDLEEYFGSKFDQAIGYDESSSDDQEAAQIMTQTMIDADFGELRILQSNMLLYLLFALIFAIALLAMIVKLCFKKVKRAIKISEIVWRAIFFNLLIRTVIET